MTNNQIIIINLVMMQIKPEQGVDEELINKFIETFRALNPISEDEKEEIIHELHSKLAIKLDRGSCLREEQHSPWYYNAKADLNPVFWNRYMTYLAKEVHLNKKVINTIDTITDEIMDMCGDPNASYGFNRRGLIIGDVQSGKTSTYTALINKAADAGYKIIILLTGVIEKLRQQTQGRLDDGFVGIDSTALLSNKNEIFTGVGCLDKNASAISLTSATSDFSASAARQFVSRLKSLKDPVLFVLKKNKNVLENLEKWLKKTNTTDNSKIDDAPLLLVDDESDYGSVNTNDAKNEASRINACIRRLLNIFSKTTYVAVTATPFANIFIDPDSSDEMLSDDLFPKDFIYALEAPTNYIGARTIFPEDSKYNYMLKNNDDCEEFLPQKHKKDFVFRELPLSLKEAIACFFLVNAIRDLRNHINTHRTMLVNISRFINVQNTICDVINDYVRDLQREISNYSKQEDALKHDGIAFIKEMYEKHYSNLNKDILNDENIFSWEKILGILNHSVAPIVVKTVHSGNASNSLNYDSSNSGLRLIAIGGFSLSRGLTLEGLCISYFYRNSRMYDTLMQMGRWFGYREHYADLCQIWMGQISVEWYEQISLATDELRRDIRRMVNIGATPKEFGLGVRCDERALLVTAYNKMRYSENMQFDLSLDGAVVETYVFPDKLNTNLDNLKEVESWLKELKNEKSVKFIDVDDAKNQNMAISCYQILDVPLNRIIDLLESISIHPSNYSFDTEYIIKLLREYKDNTVDKWDVGIASGSAEKENFCGIGIGPSIRKFLWKDGLIRLNKSRLGAASHALIGLTSKQKKEFENEIRKNYPEDNTKSFSQSDYFKTGLPRNPILVIYPIRLSPKTRGNNGNDYIDSEKENIIKKFEQPIVGFSIAIPSINGRQRIKCTYRVNRVKAREFLGFEEDVEEDIEIDKL